MPLPPDFMAARVDAVKRRLNVQVCSLYRADVAGQSLEIVATSGLNQNALGATFSFSQGLTGRVARTCSPLAARDIRGHADYFHVQGSDEERYRSYLGIPLVCEGVLYGVLVVQTEAPRVFHLRNIRELHNAGKDLLDGLRLMVI